MHGWGFSFWRRQSDDGTESLQPQSPCSDRALPWKLRSKETLIAVSCVAFIALSYLALVSTPTNFYGAILPLQIRNFFRKDDSKPANPVQHRSRIEVVFEKAALPNRTVILTTLNAAWAENNTMIDLFLESFRRGNGTEGLLKHLVIVSLDQKAYSRCVEIHHLCLKIKTSGVNFSGEQALLSADYIKMIWRRIKFLTNVLEMNYSFVFTDADILWFRNPFPLLLRSDADFQIACDHYDGSSEDVGNNPNAGFVFVRANERTIKFYKYWYKERSRNRRWADQEVFNAIKQEEEFTAMGMKLRFLDTQFIGGFCAIKTTDMSKAVTMHATCCKGLVAKLADLRAMLERWKRWYGEEQVRPEGGRKGKVAVGTFPEPNACWRSWERHSKKPPT